MDEAEYEHCRRCGNGYQSQMIHLSERIKELEGYKEGTERINDMAKFRDMQEQGTFHAGREYERKILTKRIKELEAALEEIGLTNSPKEHWEIAEKALKGK